MTDDRYRRSSFRFPCRLRAISNALRTAFSSRTLARAGPALASLLCVLVFVACVLMGARFRSSPGSYAPAPVSPLPAAVAFQAAPNSGGPASSREDEAFARTVVWRQPLAAPPPSVPLASYAVPALSDRRVPLGRLLPGETVWAAISGGDGDGELPAAAGADTFRSARGPPPPRRPEAAPQLPVSFPRPSAPSRSAQPPAETNGFGGLSHFPPQAVAYSEGAASDVSSATAPSPPPPPPHSGSADSAAPIPASPPAPRSAVAGKSLHDEYHAGVYMWCVCGHTFTEITWSYLGALYRLLLNSLHTYCIALHCRQICSV